MKYIAIGIVVLQLITMGMIKGVSDEIDVVRGENTAQYSLLAGMCEK